MNQYRVSRLYKKDLKGPESIHRLDYGPVSAVTTVEEKVKNISTWDSSWWFK